MADLLSRLVAEVNQASTSAEFFEILERAWWGYLQEGAGCFDWDYESRDLMHAITNRRAALQ